MNTQCLGVMSVCRTEDCIRTQIRVRRAGAAPARSRRVGYPTLVNGHDSFWHRIDQRIPGLVSRYFRLLLVVGPPRSGKTTALRHLAEERGWSVVNVNLRLSERLLEFTSRRRPHEVQRILDGIVSELRSQPVLLDNTEILFNPTLRLDPLRLLQRLARNRSVVASWSGNFDGDRLTYSVPGHTEFRQCEHPDALIVSVGSVPVSEQYLATTAAITDSG